MATILLADDDAAVRDLVSRALKQDGHSVHATHDGLEALEYLTDHSAAVDLLVTDVNMPQLDGITLAGKALALKPALSIVLMSGFTEELEKAQALKAKRLAAITKPFTLEQFRTKVRALLG